MRVPVKVGITDGSVTEVEGIEPGREVITDVAKSKTPAAGAPHNGL